MNTECTSQRAAQPSRLSERRIGYVGHDIPIELILAAGATPTGIHGRADQETPRADRYVESTFSPASRSIAEQWLNGELDDLEAVIFSRSDDSAQRLYYYLCELQRRGLCRGPTPLMYDIAGCDRPSSLAHTSASTRHLAGELGTSADALTRAIQRVHERTQLLAAAVESTLAPPPARGSFTQGLMRAADRDWSEPFDQTLRAAQDPSPVQIDATRLMLIGSTPPDERLHEAVERSGANIVATLNPATPHRLDSRANEGNAFDQIARRCRAHSWRAQLQSPEGFCDRASELRIAGVILWTVTEDAGLAWACPRIERALQARGISVLPLTMQRWNASTQTLDAIAAFAAKMRSNA
jgi:hypothetical protein